MVEQRSECPCKLLPLSLSSFTAAEYGDIHSLSKIQNVATRRDDAGYTPLHFAAQFNHLAATALLLNLGCFVDGGGYCGATPLHRASFSGATATMKVILEWNSVDISFCHPTDDDNTDSSNNSTAIIPISSSPSQLSERKHCNILARDTSFGDESTPLHKAAAGGRYLAVHILLEALKERDSRLQHHQNNTIRESSSSSKKSSWLQCGLEARDKYGRTSLDVATHFREIQDTERAAVARWDAVAGGLADWEKCIQLLQNANAAAVAATAVVVNIEKESKTNNTQDTTAMDNNHPSADSSSSQSSKNTSLSLPQLPVHLTKGVYECLACDASGNNLCMTSSWQAAFQKALGDSANLCIVAPTTASKHNITATTATTIKPVMLQQDTTGESSISSRGKTDETDTKSDTSSTSSDEKVVTVQTIPQSICPGCQKQCIAFYPVPGGTLVCKSCCRAHHQKRKNLQQPNTITP